MTPAAKDRYWMIRALALARRGMGTTQPNPMVGAIVLTAQGKKVGDGFHRKAGEPHAEILALNAAGELARGGTLFVTLEPCAHHGRTPPCVDRVIASGVRRVVVASVDPNPLVNGSGIAKLKSAGIEVQTGCLEEAAKKLNSAFFLAIQRKRPLVIAKAAITFDAKIGTVGRRLFISDPVCESTTMRLRAQAGAVLIGAQTLTTDDSLLTVRGKYADRTPIRAIVDGSLRAPRSSRIFSDSASGPVWVFCHEETLRSPMGKHRAEDLQSKGVRIVTFETEHEILHSLFVEGVHSVLIEGGSRTYGRFTRAGLIDGWVLYLSPRVLGDEFEGRKTVPFIEGGDYHLQFHSAIRRGADIEIVATQKR